MNGNCLQFSVTSIILQRLENPYDLISQEINITSFVKISTLFVIILSFVLCHLAPGPSNILGKLQSKWKSRIYPQTRTILGCF